MANLFHVIEDSAVILRSNGVFKQGKCFSRDGRVYAAHGSGFIKLFKHQKGTSTPRVSWDEVQLPFPVEYDSQGVMIAREQ